MRFKWALVAASVLMLAAAAGGGVWYYRAQQAERAKAAEAEAARKRAAAPAISGELSLTGLISAKEITNIAAPMEGRVLTYHVEVGDEVHEGQLLAQIQNESFSTHQQAATEQLENTQERINQLESSLAAARLEASRAAADYQRVRGELERATRVYNRQQLLLKEGATPRQVFEKAEAEYKTLSSDITALENVAKGAEGRLTSLQQTLDSTRKALEQRSEDLEAARARVDAGQVFSPVNGIVLSRRGAAGDDVNPAMDDLFRIATDVTNLLVTVEPPPAALPKIQPGMAALVLVADVPGEALSGTIRGMENGRVLIDFSSPTPLVKPGQSAQVRLRIP